MTGRTRTHHVWTDELDAKLAEVYPGASWSEIFEAFPGFTKTALHQRAIKLRIRRWNPGNGATGAIQAGTATEAEIGWLAGFIDGEGTLQLSLARHKPHKAAYLRPNVVVVNNSREAAEKVQRLMGGHMSEHRPGTWAVRVTGIARVGKLLDALMPHLTVKRRRAELLLEYRALRQNDDLRREYGPDEVALYNDFYLGSGRASASRARNARHGNAELILPGGLQAEMADHV